MEWQSDEEQRAQGLSFSYICFWMAKHCLEDSLFNLSCFNYVNVQCPWRQEPSDLHGAGVSGSCQLLTRVGAGN